MEFQIICRDAVNVRLRNKSAIYKDIRMTHNNNNVYAKSIYLPDENKYADSLDIS